MNFVFASLCDNDFGVALLNAVEHVWENQECDLTEEDFKFFVIEYVVFASTVRRIHPRFKITPQQVEHLRNYMNTNLKVTYEAKPPAVDHDGGSVVLNTHTGTYWLT